MDPVIDANMPLRFGSFELDVRSRELWNGSTRIRLQEQPFEILRMLLARPGTVVSRGELQQRLWPSGTFVDFEHSLNAAVKRLRIALGDDADNPKFVETVPRRGYRFIAGTATDSAARASAASHVRLAVLPFVDLSRGHREDFFADGLTEEMIAQLGRQLCRDRIGVISLHSSMVFRNSGLRGRDIGEALRADYLLEGSARREGHRVRITSRLIESASETQLWVDTYERDLSDSFAIQKDVTASIARSLAMELIPDEIPNLAEPALSNGLADRPYLKNGYSWDMLAAQGGEQPS
jgi:TolB-like protein